MNGLIVDLFAGGGGASTGLEMALGRSPDIAINHNVEALAMHAVNHPTTRHLCANVLRVLPLVATGGKPVDVLHASPDCTHFSKAKGGKPRSQFIRDLAWVVVRWAEDVRPTLITLENVEEFQTWGPLDKAGQPIKAESGATFRSWVRRLRRLGYRVDWRELRACDFGAPTTRKRLFVVARRDGKPIVWPKPSHGAPDSMGVRTGVLRPWRTAAECIDWSLPTQSIFNRKKPLALNTQRRIAEGIRRYVLDAATPFLVTYYGAKAENDFRGQALASPLPTQTTENRFGLVSPFLTKFNTGSVGYGCDEPIHTIISGGQQKRPGTAITQGLVAANLVKLRGTNVGSPLDCPLHTVSAQGQHHALTSACLIKYYGSSVASPLLDPAHTVTSKDHMGLVTACLDSMDRTAQVRDFLRRWGVIGPDCEAVVTVNGETYHITDIALRMLKPRELFRAQGFPDSYSITPTVNGKPLSATSQVRMCGNSVPPQFVAALVKANGPETWVIPEPRRLPLLECVGI